MKKLTASTVIFLMAVLAGYAADQVTVKKSSKKELAACKNKCKKNSNACVKDAVKMNKEMTKKKNDAKSKQIAKLMLDDAKAKCAATKSSCLGNCDSEYGPKGGD
ncbi:MAG: hypothetical protein MUD12_13470 [Spirochaetes bacterium]|nr:hypothetical protein [Spirochaetota bacterium]